MRGGRPQVEDWSWAQTKRRLRALYRLARPYKARTLLAIVSLLGATAVALAPPYLVGRAVDEVRHGAHGDCSAGSSSLFVVAGVLGIAFTYGADVLHRLDGRADARRPAQPPLPPPAAPLARLLRAQPRRRDHQPAHERRRGARPARHRRRHVARPEHADARRHRRHPLLPRLAARARDADGRCRRWRSRPRCSASARAAPTARVRETLGAVTATLAEDIAGMRVLQSFTRERAAQRELPRGQRRATARRTCRRSS